SVAEQVEAGQVKVGVFLKVVGPIGYEDSIVRFLPRLDCVLINSSRNQAKVVDDFRSLRTFARPKKAWDCDRGEQSDDCYYDHDFHQREASAFVFEFIKHK